LDRQKSSIDTIYNSGKQSFVMDNTYDLGLGLRIKVSLVKQKFLLY